MNGRHRQTGFTLIELLVVISIISLLASIVLASLNDARIQGRNSKRLQEAAEIRKVINIIQLETGEALPNNGTWTCFGGSATDRCYPGPSSGFYGNAAAKALTDKYFSSYPMYGVNSYQNSLLIYRTGPLGTTFVWGLEDMTAKDCPGTLQVSGYSINGSGGFGGPVCNELVRI